MSGRGRGRKHPLLLSQGRGGGQLNSFPLRLPSRPQRPTGLLGRRYSCLRVKTNMCLHSPCSYISAHDSKCIRIAATSEDNDQYFLGGPLLYPASPTQQQHLKENSGSQFLWNPFFSVAINTACILWEGNDIYRKGGSMSLLTPMFHLNIQT